MRAFEARHAADIAHAAPDFRPSVRNLLHYLALRRLDLRQMQSELAALGLSSLGRMESYALDRVRNVQRSAIRPSTSKRGHDFHCNAVAVQSPWESSENCPS